MSDTHTALSITISDPEQQSVNEVLDDISTIDTEGEDIDGVELHIPRISGENAITILEHMINDGHDTAVTELVIELRQ
jgi:hypothetical protein